MGDCDTFTPEYGPVVDMYMPSIPQEDGSMTQGVDLDALIVSEMVRLAGVLNPK
jgi:hypothetical protein